MPKTPKIKPTNIDPIDAALVDIGLNDDQAVIYKSLLSLGPSKAHRVAFQSGVKRALTYKVLSQLKDIGLVEAKETNEDKVTTFYPSHPSNLENLIQNKTKMLSNAQSSYENVIQSLTSSYNLSNKKPNVQFFEGIKGLHYVFDDILKKRADVLIFRSYLDTASKDVSEIIDDYRVRRKRLGLKVRLISSRPFNKELLEEDKENFVTRKYLSQEKFPLPAEITVYEDKVAIISYKDPMMTTVIENQDIKTTFKVLFELLWSQAETPKT